MCPWQQSSVLCCVPGNLEDLALTETPRGPPGAGRGFPGGHASPLAVGLGPCRLCRGPRAPGHTAAAQRAAQRVAALPAALKPGLAWGRGPRPGPLFPSSSRIPSPWSPCFLPGMVRAVQQTSCSVQLRLAVRWLSWSLWSPWTSGSVPSALAPFNRISAPSLL